MADFEQAVRLTLQHEGGFYHNPETGEIVNFGITAKFLASIGEPCTLHDVQILTRMKVVQLYRNFFWTQNRLSEVRDQALANKIFDLAVNMGSHEAVKLLQSAVGAEVDGIAGKETIAAVNAADPVAALKHFQELAEARYREIAAHDPNHSSDLVGWLRRLQS